MNLLNLSSANLRFEPYGHRHLMLINGSWTQVPGCTSVSGLFQDDGWKFAWPVKLMHEHLLPFAINKKPISQAELLRAKNAWRGNRDSAASKGTDAHSLIEGFIKTGNIPPISKDEDVAHSIEQFFLWRDIYKPEWLAAEIQIGSEAHRFAGILDALATVRGKLALIDFKTSGDIWVKDKFKKRVHPKQDYIIQLAGLMIALKEMGCEPLERYILHLPKTGDPFEFLKIDTDLEFEKECFLAGLEQYRYSNLLDERIKRHYSQKEAA